MSRSSSVRRRPCTGVSSLVCEAGDCVLNASDGLGCSIEFRIVKDPDGTGRISAGTGSCDARIGT